MSDDQNVDAGSETSGEQAEDTNAVSVTEQSDTNATAETTTTDTASTDTAQASTDTSADAGGAADTEEPANAEESRTGFVSGARAGDECICPDGRKGTVHKFDEGLVCIPNHEQSE